MDGATLHKGGFVVGNCNDIETLKLMHDLWEVMASVHQGMMIYGPWFENRIRHLLSQKLPGGWRVSGPSQIFRQDQPGLRSRSWDLVVHRDEVGDLPTASSPDTGYPLLPLALVSAVIDTKTMFNDVSKYASQPAFNLRNNCTAAQVSFLGPTVTKIVLAASSNKPPSTLREHGVKNGIDVFSLSRTTAGPVSDFEEREWISELMEIPDEGWPLSLFFTTVADSIRRHN